MHRGTIARVSRRAAALAVVAALLASSSAFATGLSTSRRPTTTVTTSEELATSSSTRTQVTEGSEIDVTVDQKTEAFRKELAARQKRLDEFETQLFVLDKELELATEQYNDARARLTEMRATVETAKEDLDKARLAYEIQTEILGDRASDIYRDGSLNVLDVLLGSESVADFVARVKFLNTMGVRDADIAGALKGQKDLLETQVTELKTAQAAAQSVEFELKARQIEVMLRIQERQQMFAEAQADLIALLDAEAARRQLAQQQLLAEILSGADTKGIVVKPGTPVETALAYHGVPYLWGGETPRGFDCSGLVLYVYEQHGVKLPHYSGSQFQLGTKVQPSDLVAGDVVFFGSPIHHVGIYLGGGYYIHAPRTGDFVKISKLADRSDFAGARRYSWTYRTGAPRNAVTDSTQVLQTYDANVTR